MRRILALAACLVFPVACSQPAAGQGGEGVLSVATRAIRITDADLDGLKLRGTIALSAAHKVFGGFSGIVVRDGHFSAVSDIGWLLEGDLIDGPHGQSVDRTTFRRLRDSDGRGFGKRDGDAEGLAFRGGELWVAFERDHRIVRYDGTRPARAIRDRLFETLRSNSGLEALASLPDGRLLAIAEGRTSAGFPVFVTTEDGQVVRGHLPAAARHAVTGADIGPDGRLYVVLRDYMPLLGVSIRIHRYRLTPQGLPDPATRQQLAAFESISGVDNMEGIALWTDTAGRVRLTLIADDNYNLLQRTLVMDFEVLGPPD